MTIKTSDTRDEWRADRPNHIEAMESITPINLQGDIKQWQMVC